MMFDVGVLTTITPAAVAALQVLVFLPAVKNKTYYFSAEARPSFQILTGRPITTCIGPALHDSYPKLKLSLTHCSRIWYFIVGNHVFIDEVFTSHPNQTK
jgi:hypothetical protein